MMVMAEFVGDDNRTLMNIQHSAYGDLLVVLFVAPRDRYLAACNLLRLEDGLSEQLRSMNGFDHRTLQLAHDRIAAYFRFKSPDSAQFLLGEEENAHRKRLEETWRRFFTDEVAALVQDDEFIRAICSATAFGNKDAGVAAEKWIDRFLVDRYSARGLDAWKDSNWSSLRLPV